MKRILISLVTVLIFSFSHAQGDLDKAYRIIADHICECSNFKSDEFKNASVAEATNIFSSCGLKFYGDNKNTLNELGFKLDTDMEANRALWEQVGIVAATTCPDLFLGLNRKKNQEAEASGEEVYEELPYVVGKITEIEKGTFPIFKIIDVDGRKHNLLWLTIIDNPVLFEEALKGEKNFVLEYYESELYDDRIKEYRYMKVLNAVKVQ
ncbi:hypothetical protein [Nonlabens marinus]|uniref:Uncharacterized protein n=1 Tax=Nonlabens marinus S1-08 TaxID=1454201 RepID=W8VXU6_9FLAO|nr:hypothetical protein [Nonlabens marinus]BAO56542.1 hypothetical protein NMS_2533 [Nonlabens marinus S1-08]